MLQCLQILRPLCGDIIICNQPLISQCGPSFMKFVMESMSYVSSLAQASLMVEAIGALSSYYKGPSRVMDEFFRAGMANTAWFTPQCFNFIVSPSTMLVSGSELQI